MRSEAEIRDKILELKADKDKYYRERKLIMSSGCGIQVAILRWVIEDGEAA